MSQKKEKKQRREKLKKIENQLQQAQPVKKMSFEEIKSWRRHAAWKTNIHPQILSMIDAVIQEYDNSQKMNKIILEERDEVAEERDKFEKRVYKLEMFIQSIMKNSNQPQNNHI